MPEVDAPNVAGVRAFGFGDDVASLRSAVEGGRVTALYVYDPGPATLGDVAFRYGQAPQEFAGHLAGTRVGLVFTAPSTRLLSACPLFVA